eukprot:scaffold1206_cov388-Prasinococcus_capsulatus_cf.AAC.46
MKGRDVLPKVNPQLLPVGARQSAGVHRLKIPRRPRGDSTQLCRSMELCALQISSRANNYIR